MIRALLPIVLVALMLTLACDGDEGEVRPFGTKPPSSAPTPTTREPSGTFIPFTPTAPTPTPRQRPEANPFPEDLHQSALSLLTQIGEVRGTPARREIDLFVLTREQARAFYEGEADPSGDEAPSDAVDADEEAPPRPFNLRQETYVLLGLVPPPEPSTGAGDVQDQQLDNLLSQITGFYSNELGALYLVENSGSCVQLESTIVHELTHALQYQYRDIDGLIRDRAGDWDGQRALLTVLEGDAVYTETLVLGFSTRSNCVRQPVCFEIPPPRSASPYVIERELDTWYEDGFCFISAVRDKLTRGITGIFEDLPTTTEQILHPDKYLAGETARPVFLNSLGEKLGPGWEQKGRGNFGEFSLQNLLLTGLPDAPSLVQAAAAGWGGDSFFFYAHEDGARLLHLETRWDSGAQAIEFFAALVTAIVNLSHDDPPQPGANRYRASVGDVTWSTTVASDRVTLLVSTDPDALEAAAETVE
ncbi:MAG TPA: hypothetical protein VFS30_13710 [Dehalococcoidia bacterium]|nr:hypothetical protein [Dehalococcoidia bacterium]